MEVDILVHPGRNLKYLSAEEGERFLSATVEVAKASDLAILVTTNPPRGWHGKDMAYKDVISPENMFRSTTRSGYIGGGSYFVLGTVKRDSETWGRFKELMQGRQDESVRIHGRLGKMSAGFAEQLLTFFTEGVYWETMEGWRNLNPSEEAEKAFFDLKREREDGYELNGAYAKSKIRYGHVVDTGASSNIVPKSLSGLIPIFGPKDKRHGSMDFQLMDDKTVVYQGEKQAE
jgi:hypothetical protein